MNFQDLDDKQALIDIDTINPYIYEMKDNPGVKQYGFKAQDLLNRLPFAVESSYSNTQPLFYTDLTVLKSGTKSLWVLDEHDYLTYNVGDYIIIKDISLNIHIFKNKTNIQLDSEGNIEIHDENNNIIISIVDNQVIIPDIMGNPSEIELLNESDNEEDQVHVGNLIHINIDNNTQYKLQVIKKENNILSVDATLYTQVKVNIIGKIIYNVYSVNYSSLIPVITSACQEIHKITKTQKTEIDELKNKHISLESRLLAIETKLASM